MQALFESGRAADVVLLALKTTQNHGLKDLLPGLLKPDGVVLVLQNLCFLIFWANLLIINL
jgi:ketopantoate reductase